MPDFVKTQREAIWVCDPRVEDFSEDLDAVDLPALAPTILAAPLFSEGINVGVAQMLSDDESRLSLYERPGVLTTARGSGAWAPFQSARLSGHTDRHEMTVHMSAGSVTVRIRPDLVGEMTGPVAHCFAEHYRFPGELASFPLCRIQYPNARGL